MRPEVQVLYRPPRTRAASRPGQLDIESYERDEPRREDQREPAPRGSWLRATAIPSVDGTTRERPVNRSGIRPLERPRARDAVQTEFGAVAKAGGTARDASRPVGREALCLIDSPRQPAGGNSASRRHGRRHMGEDKEAKVPAPGEIAGQAGDIDEYFEAVVRGSAEELLDAGAHSD